MVRHRVKRTDGQYGSDPDMVCSHLAYPTSHSLSTLHVRSTVILAPTLILESSSALSAMAFRAVNNSYFTGRRTTNAGSRGGATLATRSRCRTGKNGRRTSIICRCLIFCAVSRIIMEFSSRHRQYPDWATRFKGNKFPDSTTASVYKKFTGIAAMNSDSVRQGCTGIGSWNKSLLIGYQKRKNHRKLEFRYTPGTGTNGPIFAPCCGAQKRPCLPC